jgi:phosphoserine phosphatase
MDGDLDAHAIDYHAAGQGPLLHYRAATRECLWLSPTTFPMGYMRYPQIDPPERIALAPGDILGLISDGVFESEDRRGCMFGTEGVETVLRAGLQGTMSDLLARMLQAVHVHADGHAQADDITIVLLEQPLVDWGIRSGKPADEVDIGFKVNV